jgi:peptidoglycan/xylan/chitin deacetylase (PgdA/CDA1 family)
MTQASDKNAKATPSPRRIHKVRSLLNAYFKVVSWAGLASPDRTVVLTYHSIRPPGLYKYSTSAALFEAHLEWLAAHCTVVGFEEVLLPAEQPRGKPRVAITFDDGYQDNVEIALPLLQKYRLTATFFITTGLLQKDTPTLNRLAANFGNSLEQMGPLNFAGLRALDAAGMHIGAHTHSHHNLRQLSPKEQREELYKSRAILEDALGKAVPTMSYPYGLPGYAVDAGVSRASLETGYRLAATVHLRAVRPLDDPGRIPRFVLTDENLQDLRTIVFGGMDVVGWYQDVTFSLLRK